VPLCFACVGVVVVVSYDVILLVAISACIHLVRFMGRTPFLLGESTELQAPMEDSAAPLSVGALA